MLLMQEMELVFGNKEAEAAEGQTDVEVEMVL